MKNLYIYKTIYDYIVKHCPNERLPYDLNKEIILFDKYIFSSSINMTILKDISNFLETFHLKCDFAWVNNYYCIFGFSNTEYYGQFRFSFNLKIKDLDDNNHLLALQIINSKDNAAVYFQKFTNIKLFNKVLDKFKEWLVEN